MVIWLTKGQVKRMLSESKIDQMWLEDNEKLYFGDDKDVEFYFDGSDFIVDGSDNYYFKQASGSNLFRINKGTTYNAIVLYDDNGNLFQMRISKGSANICYFSMPAATNMFILSNSYVQTKPQYFRPYNDDWVELGTSSLRFKLLRLSEILSITATNLTSGAIIDGSVDSDVFTGNVIDIKSGSDANTSIFTLSRDGEVSFINYSQATATNTTVPSQNLNLTGHFWNGSQSVEHTIRLRNNIFSTSSPIGELGIINSAGGACYIRPDPAGKSTIFGGSATGYDLYLQANKTDTYPFIELLGNSTIHLQVGSGSGIYFDVAGTTEFGIEANKVDFNGSVWYNPANNAATGVATLSYVITVNIGGTNYYIPAYASYS